MIRLMTVLSAVLCLTLAASADPPCHVQKIVAPQRIYPHAIHSATIFHDTHLHLVEVPVPAFVFQTLSAYQPPAVQVVQQAAPPAADGIGTDDLLQALMGGQPLTASPVAEIAAKCAACHSLEKGTSKGGLALFDQVGHFAPTSRSGKTLTRNAIAARARSTEADVMPPAAAKDPTKRLSEAAAAYLEQ